jgi:phosphoribosylformimino-5-aminoimidazole carboxamide ribotide isomerase
MQRMFAESLEFVAEMVAEFGSERVAVGVDAKDGKVSTKGWTQESGLLAADLIKAAVECGAGTIIYTDIAKDGMLEGPNYTELARVLELLKGTGAGLIASGGVSGLDDIIRLAQMPELYGAIIGKALYDNKMTLRAARQAMDL